MKRHTLFYLLSYLVLAGVLITVNLMQASSSQYWGITLMVIAYGVLQNLAGRESEIQGRK
jgi:hypothetical protein